MYIQRSNNILAFDLYANFFILFIVLIWKHMQWKKCVCTVSNNLFLWACVCCMERYTKWCNPWLAIVEVVFCSRRFCKTYNYNLANTFHENGSVTIHKCKVKQKEIFIGPINLFCFKKLHFRVYRWLMSIASF